MNGERINLNQNQSNRERCKMNNKQIDRGLWELEKREGRCDFPIMNTTLRAILEAMKEPEEKVTKTTKEIIDEACEKIREICKPDPIQELYNKLEFAMRPGKPLPIAREFGIFNEMWNTIKKYCEEGEE